MKSKQNEVFVLMPFRQPFNDIYKSIIRPSLEGCNLQCRRADELGGLGVIVEEIIDHIRKARFMVADFTGLNPNVCYEIGVAHALRKTVILISDAETPIPFDIGFIRCIRYENTKFGLAELRTKLSQAIAIAKRKKTELPGFMPPKEFPVSSYPNAVQHVSLVVNDWKASTRFYRDTVGLKPMGRPDYRFHGTWFLLENGQHLHLVQKYKAGAKKITLQDGRKVSPVKPFPPHFAFSVRDYKAAHERLTAAKVKITGDPCPELGICQFYFHDIDGNLVEINNGLEEETERLSK